MDSLARNLVQRVNVGDLLTRSAARFPTKTAIIDGTRRFTFQQFNAWSNRVANGLSSLGYQPGDTLALMSDNCAEFLVTYFACAKLGAVCVPINLFWRDKEITYVLEHAAVKGAIVGQSRLDQFLSGTANHAAVRDVFVIGDEVEPQRLPGQFRVRTFEALCRDQSEQEPAHLIDDRAPLSYLYTSGTTSAPKGVVGSHLAVYLNSLGTAIDTRMSDRDCVAAFMPMFHTAQLNAICTPALAVGASVCIMKEFETAALLDAIERESISVLFALPMMYRALIEEQQARPRGIASLRLAVYAMAVMPEQELHAALETLDCEFSLMFGQTEMSPVAAFFRPEHQLSHPGAVGTPAMNVQVSIMDEEGRLLPQGQMGEIVYRSPQTLTGYLDNEKATEEAFRFGWFHSGDIGHFDADGILWFHDRNKDVIKSGGENISSLEIEKALYEIEPNVAEVAVIGLPHERWTEAVTAVVVTRPGANLDEADLLARLRNAISPFKCPKAIVFVNQLPKTATGKVQKAELRKEFIAFFENSGGTPER
ncbi:Long-chain-fatty-acid--CoA ligase [compost metagenome]